MSAPLLVYVTCADPAQAAAIARAVVGEGLAACANILPGMTAVYRWQGAVEESAETLLLLKTLEHRLPALQARVRALHSYQCPCVVAVPIAAGTPDYLAWLAESVIAPAAPSP
ncbi:MAG: divalent-cation tolerance protein CutA [Planctomycetes bacterium]|nr:divalent-cation tolerance protein CutA [Planctomycetota bacterium]